MTDAELAEARLSAWRDAERENTELHAEIGRLRAQRILSNEDFARSFDLGLAAGEKRERAAVVAWLRGEPERLVACDGHRHADGKPCFVLSPMPADELADAIDRGEHRREEEP